MAENVAGRTMECYLCKQPCDGSMQDDLAEYVFRRGLPVCEKCDEHLANEPFDHKDWS